MPNTPAAIPDIHATLPHEQERNRLSALVRGWVHDALAGTLSAEEFATHMTAHGLDPRFVLEHLGSHHPQELLVLSRALTAVNARVEEMLTGEKVVHDHGVIVTRRPLQESAA